MSDTKRGLVELGAALRAEANWMAKRRFTTNGAPEVEAQWQGQVLGRREAVDLMENCIPTLDGTRQLRERLRVRGNELVERANAAEQGSNHALWSYQGATLVEVGEAIEKLIQAVSR